jgi:membrane protein YqaA with SNARE-associated domain
VLFFVYYYEQEQIIGWMKSYYPVWLIYSHVSAEISGRTLLGLFYASFFGGLFFVFIPVELIFIYYSALPYPHVWIVGITILGNLLGLAVDYAIGRMVGLGIVKKLLKERFEKFSLLLMKYGGLVIFVGNILIFPIEIITLLIGAGKYPFKRFLLLSALGKLAKYVIMLLAQQWLITYVVPHLKLL